MLTTTHMIFDEDNKEEEGAAPAEGGEGAEETTPEAPAEGGDAPAE